MPPEVSQTWDALLQQLLASRVLDGYGLLDHTGKCLASFGSLSTELWGDSGSSSSAACSSNEFTQHGPAVAAPPAAGNGELCPAAQQLLALFDYSAALSHLDICGQQAVIVQQSDSSVYAVSRGKQLGLTAHYLPAGILVTVFSKPHLLQTVAPQVEAACDRLRQG